MIRIYENYSTKRLNTFRVDYNIREYVKITSEKTLIEFLENFHEPRYLVIGEGSNILFSRDYKGTVIHPLIRGTEVLKETENYCEIASYCGENWDDFVNYCCKQGLGGIENLSYIPGSVGSAPVQNIGAYGTEVKDTIIWVEGYDLKKKKLQKLSNKECSFAYRNSIFKQSLQDSFIVTKVAFRLQKKPVFNLSYGNVEEVFRQKKKQDLLSLRESIIEIRRSKLPETEEVGNAGSFFKNPVIPDWHLKHLKKSYSDIPSYKTENGFKIPAAWLIERTGWKGLREGETGTWPGQPLVIVNYSHATGLEILRFSEKIRKAVKSQFNIELEREVKVI